MSATAVMPEFPVMTPKMVSSERILSVCPLPRFKNIPIGNCIFPFQIPAQKRGQYHILEVQDTYTRIRTGFQEDTDTGVHLAPAPIPAIVLANSLVTEWNMSLANVGTLGLIILPKHVQEGSGEFMEIIRTLTGQVREVAEWAIRQANDMFGKNKSEFITNGFHRALAVWLMGEEGARAIPWYNAQAINELKACIACSRSINATAKVCEHCGTDLVKYFIEYNLDDSADPIVAAMSKRVKIPVATEGTTSTTGAPEQLRVALSGPNLPNDARVACVNAMTGEQKAVMNTKRTQTEKDEFIISIIPDLCLKNAGLRENLMAKGYVVPNAD